MKRRHMLSGLGFAALHPLVFAQGQPRTLPDGRAAKPARGAAKLNFGLITPRNAEQTLKNWGPFLDRMGTAVNADIARTTYASQGELVKDFMEGRLDMAWLGNAPALDIVEAGKASIFAAMVVQGKTAYRSLLLTHRDSNIRTLEDVHRNAGQLVFGDGDVKSTSGHIVPRYFAFVKRGINDPDRLFKEVRRASHEGNAQALIKREVDVATNNTSELDNFKTNNPTEAALLRVVWESPDIPESPLIWRNDLPPALKTKIATFISAFGQSDPEEKGILWNINKLTAFRKSDNRQLITIADLEMFNARQRVTNDTKLSSSERATMVEDITRRGSKLELMLKRSI